MPHIDPTDRKAYHARYNKTAAGIARNLRYNKSGKKREATWRERGIVGLTYARYQQDVEACGNRCRLCTESENAERVAKGKVLVADHDHTTGKYRGLLCNRHNLAVGVFETQAPAITEYLQWTIKKSDTSDPRITGDPNGQIW